MFLAQMIHHLSSQGEFVKMNKINFFSTRACYNEISLYQHSNTEIFFSTRRHEGLVQNGQHFCYTENSVILVFVILRF
jgi:hypothetical protein